MTQPSRAGHERGLPATTDETAVSREVPFSLVWLRAVDPRTFTPYTWENGGPSTIRLTAADGSVAVNVERIVVHAVDRTITLKDEAHFLDSPLNADAITQLRYAFDAAGRLTDYDPATGLSDNMQAIVTSLSGLVYIAGSRIRASSHRAGPESDFISDGTQWIDRGTMTAPPALPALIIGRLAIEE